jgi:hypothetical protein
MHRLFLIGAAGLAAAVLACPAAATIIPQKGIAGVRIGMTPGKVRSVLGAALSEDHVKSEFGAATVFRYRGLQVTFQGGGPVTNMSTTRRGERTANGVGVGSTEAQVKAKVKGVTCKTDSGFRHCYLGKLSAGYRVTDFSIKRGKVSRVDVGVVID